MTNTTEFQPDFPALIRQFETAALRRAEQEEWDLNNGDAWGGGELADRQQAYIDYLKAAKAWQGVPIHRGFGWALVANGEGVEADSYGYVLSDLLDAASQGLMPEGLGIEPMISEVSPGVHILEF